MTYYTLYSWISRCDRHTLIQTDGHMIAVFIAADRKSASKCSRCKKLSNL